MGIMQKTKVQTTSPQSPLYKRRSLGTILRKYWFIYLLVLPGFICVAVFSYAPMYGILLAFKDYNYGKGILGSDWAGFKYFQQMFSDSYFWKVVWNTVVINLYNIAVGFTFTIFFALMLNEMKLRRTKKIAQTAVYLPYFLSWVVFAGLIRAFLDPQTGLINTIITSMGGQEVMFLTDNRYFRTVLVITNTIKEAGYDSILYLAAIAGVNPELYESAMLDGANRYHMIRHITLPSIYPTIAVLLLLRVSNLFASNFDQVFNLYNPMVYETGDVISTYIYRLGIEGGEYSVSTAMNLLFNGAGLFIILIANKFIEKLDVMGIF